MSFPGGLFGPRQRTYRERVFEAIDNYIQLNIHRFQNLPIEQQFRIAARVIIGGSGLSGVLLNEAIHKLTPDYLSKKRLRDDEEFTPNKMPRIPKDVLDFNVDPSGETDTEMDIDKPAPAPTLAAASAVQGTKRGVHETPLSRYHLTDLRRFFQNTHTTKLAWRETQLVDLAANGIGGQTVTLKPTRYYMNGIYPVDRGGAGVPQWASFWATYYQKYAVTKVDYNIEMRIMYVDGGQVTRLVDPVRNSRVCWHGVFASAIPAPTQYSDLDDHVPNHLQRKMVWVNGELNDTPPKTVISGSYVPGSTHHEIREDSQVEQWTSPLANPAYIEYLCLYFGSGHQFKQEGCRLEMYLNFQYTVQWKDLKDEYKYRKWTSAGVGSDGSQAINIA